MKTNSISYLPEREDSNSNVNINLKMNKKFLISFAVMLVLASGIVIGKYFFPSQNNRNPEPNVLQVQGGLQEKNSEISQSRETAITRAVKKVSPKIVGIN